MKLQTALILSYYLIFNGILEIIFINDFIDRGCLALFDKLLVQRYECFLYSSLF